MTITFVYDTNDCSGNPCQNGGACTVDGVGTYTCACAAGYEGADRKTSKSLSKVFCKRQI